MGRHRTFPLEATTRICIECNQEKPSAQFRHGNQCRACINRIEKEHKAKKKDVMRISKAKYYALHRSEMLAQQAVYRVLNRDKCRARVSAYARLHRPERAAVQANRHAMKRAASVGSDIAAVAAFYELSRTAISLPCYWCGKNTRCGHRHVDHVMPLSKGGLHTAGNLAISCAKCNESKKDKLPQEVGALL